MRGQMPTVRDQSQLSEVTRRLRVETPPHASPLTTLATFQWGQVHAGRCGKGGVAKQQPRICTHPHQVLVDLDRVRWCSTTACCRAYFWNPCSSPWINLACNAQQHVTRHRSQVTHNTSHKHTRTRMHARTHTHAR